MHSEFRIYTADYLTNPNNAMILDVFAKYKDATKSLKYEYGDECIIVEVKVDNGEDLDYFIRKV